MAMNSGAESLKNHHLQPMNSSQRQPLRFLSYKYIISKLYLALLFFHPTLVASHAIGFCYFDEQFECTAGFPIVGGSLNSQSEMDWFPHGGQSKLWFSWQSGPVLRLLQLRQRQFCTIIL